MYIHIFERKRDNGGKKKMETLNIIIHISGGHSSTMNYIWGRHCGDFPRTVWWI